MKEGMLERTPENMPLGQFFQRVAGTSLQKVRQHG